MFTFLYNVQVKPQNWFQVCLLFFAFCLFVSIFLHYLFIFLFIYLFIYLSIYLFSMYYFFLSDSVPFPTM